ncbi:MAG: orotidine 5'-phosphate decarboxylase / HUMPS family protein [Candidatus Methanofastidiosia archaeon]
MFEKEPGIIPALDVRLSKAEELVRELKDIEEISAFKISSLLVLEHGLREVAKRLKTYEVNLIYDHQKGCTDIPEIVSMQVEMAAKYKIDAFIAVPLGAGSASLEAFLNACKALNVLPIVLLSMSHPKADAFLSENYLEKLLLQIEGQVEFIIAPATYPEKISELKERMADVKIISPGVGPQKTGDFILDAQNAIKAGADHLVIGRAIYSAENPRRVTEEILDAIR